MRIVCLLACIASALCCPEGTFVATYSRTSCSMWNENMKSKYTTASTRGEMVSLSTAANSGCELLIAPNASLGTAAQFTVRVNTINLDASSSIKFLVCSSTDVCDEAYSLSNVAWSSTHTYTVYATSFMKIVFQAGATPPTTYASNTFLISWDSGLTLPCLGCNNLIPTPSTNWLFNDGQRIGCAWKCAPGYYIPTNGMTDNKMGGFVTTGSIACVPCTLCSGGTFTNPAAYDGGCWGYASNDGAYGAVVNSKDSSCKQCSTCAPAVAQACTQLSDTVCATSVREVAKPMVSFK